MRTIEKVIIIPAVIVFITAVGAGIFDAYIQNFGKGIDVFLELGKHSTNALIAVIALMTTVATSLNYIKGKSYRGTGKTWKLGRRKKRGK
ncbi:hypothetical protein LCGC14_0659280 [marine sediment metagenome]|uniref:Uncharacterized protein n=1 Tax=marine sediment metagenome TaxID=412755 RepID=A0A0F9RE13_9ZZZZ